MENLFEINTNKKFDLSEASQLIDLLLSITRKSKNQVNIINSQIGCVPTNSPRFNELQKEANDLIKNWSNKVNRLGLTPLSLWKVKIPSSTESDYVWEFPKDKLDSIDTHNPKNH